MITVRTIYPPPSTLEARLEATGRRLATESEGLTGPWLVVACVYPDRVEISRLVATSVPELKHHFDGCGCGCPEVRLLHVSPGLHRRDFVRAAPEATAVRRATWPPAGGE